MQHRIKVGFDEDRPDGEQWIVIIYARRGFSTHCFPTQSEAQDFAQSEVNARRDFAMEGR